MSSLMDRADDLAKSRGYIGIWSMPRELRETIIEEAQEKLPRSMEEVLDRQMQDHQDPLAPVRSKEVFG